MPRPGPRIQHFYIYNMHAARMLVCLRFSLVRGQLVEEFSIKVFFFSFSFFSFFFDFLLILRTLDYVGNVHVVVETQLLRVHFIRARPLHISLQTNQRGNSREEYII